MRMSHYFLPTVKEIPADAEIVSHQLMLRSAMIRKLASGLYTWLPLGLKVLKKIENIIRDEMNRAGALEIFMPACQPAEIWQESGRWDTYNPPLLKLKDRHQRDFCYGPTHEEVITDVMRKELRSYKQLPLICYQIQNKFRDELRPRSGILRAREFLMKDAYSFHVDKESLAETYDVMFQAYCNILTRLGLDFRAVLADTGSIGGFASHEFQILAESGEDTIAISDESDYAANIELAEAIAPTNQPPEPKASMEKVATPNQRTIEEVARFLKIPETKNLKSLIVNGTESPLVALILRGDHQLNEVKAEKHPWVAEPLTFASAEDIAKHLSCNTGSIGPVNLPIPYIVDRSAAVLSDFVCGANEDDFHYTGVNWGRDVVLSEVADLRKVVAGDPSPDGKGKLKLVRGIEAGHIFQLGDKYSKPMNATVLDENGKEVVLQMGCYGMGVSRLVASCIEQNHDERGICWPEPMAPFQVMLIPINMNKSQRLREACEQLYKQLNQAGIEVLFDDRNERPGFMFADCDLIGIPHRLVLSDRGLDAKTVEYKHRCEPESRHIPMNEVMTLFQKNI